MDPRPELSHFFVVQSGLFEPIFIRFRLEHIDWHCHHQRNNHDEGHKFEYPPLNEQVDISFATTVSDPVFHVQLGEDVSTQLPQNLERLGLVEKPPLIQTSDVKGLVNGDFNWN